jgi:hypothetical protein
MKKTFLKFGAFIVAGSMFVGCNKDEDVKAIEPEFPTEYSELTVAQNKTKLEDNGVSLMNNITTLEFQWHSNVHRFHPTPGRSHCS